METIYIKTEYIKLDQLLKYSGIVENGSMAKYIIKDGNINVNNQVCIQRGKKIYPNDIVEIKNHGSIIVKINK